MLKRYRVVIICALFLFSTINVYHIGKDPKAMSEIKSENAFTILLVDADTNAWGTTTYYSTALTNIGAAYTLWDVYGNSGPAQGKPTSADMSPYNVVIWVPDKDMNWDGSPFDATDEGQVGVYLSGGGNFLLSNIVWTDFTDSASYDYDFGDFAYDYMGIDMVNGWSGNEAILVGVPGDLVYDGWGPVFQDWQGGWGGFPPFMSDDLTATPSAVECIMNDDGFGTQAIGGVRLDGGSYRTAFWGFPFETITGLDADDLMNRTIEWFYSTPGLPQMTLNKTAPAAANPGETFMYTIDYSCNNSDAYNVEVTETYPLDITFVDSNPPPTIGDNFWALGNLPPGTNGTIFINVTVSLSATGILTNQVDLHFEDSIGTVYSDSDFTVTDIINPTMQITKWAPATANQGEIITYWINYTNTGTDWAYNVVLTESYPSDVTFIWAIPVPDIGDNIWIIPALAPGSSDSIEINVQIDLDALLGTNLNNYVTLDYENHAGLSYLEDDSTVTVVIGPIMTINKGAPAYVEPIGENITYHIRFMNIGNDWAYNVVITEFYPFWVTYISANLPPTSGDNIWVIPAIAPSDTIDIYITVHVNILATGSLVNYVELVYESESGMTYPTINDTAITNVISGTFPIRIDSNADFDPTHGVTGGNGTEQSPWIIDNYEINGTGRGNCIYVGNTTDHFIIRNCSLHYASGLGYGTWPFYGDIGLILYNVTNGIVENNTVSNCNYRGIYLYEGSCSNKVIKNNVSYNSQSDIHLSNHSNDNVIFNNTVTYTDWGFVVYNSSNNTIEANTANSNDFYGIYLSDATDNTIKNNIALSNYENGIYLLNASHNDIIGNNCSDNLFRAGISAEDQSNYNYIADNICLNNTFQGIRLDWSHWNTIENNTCMYNLNNGIYSTGPIGSIITGNNCSYNTNYHGISLDINTRNNWVTDNDLVKNNLCGIYAEFAHNNNIINNSIMQNLHGIEIIDSDGCVIYHNNIIGNTIQALDNGLNSWDNGYPSGGNYWSDYTGVDYNSTPTQDVPPPDGIGDTPYIIDGDSQDDYPLMEPWTPYVGPVHNIDKDIYYPTIQEGIDDADPGNTIFVTNGTYYENVQVDISLTLIGEDRNSTIIDGNGTGTAIDLDTNWVNISGFTIMSSPTDIGISQTPFVNYITVENNIITNNRFGCLLSGHHSNVINNIAINNEYGIWVSSSHNNTVANNYVDSGNTSWATGIFFDDNQDSVAYNNTITNYSWTGLRLSSCTNVTAYSNTLYDNWYGFRVGSSTLCVLRDNYVSNSTDTGFYISLSDHNEISNNQVYNDTIFLWTSNNNTIAENAITNSNGYSILLMTSNNNTIIRNILSWNSQGVYLWSDTNNNTVYHNSFMYNTRQAYDRGNNNTWNNGYPSGGNYWSDYFENDFKFGVNQDQPGSDGIGDIFYTYTQSSSTVIDRYPLMAPFEYTEYDVPLQEGWNLISLPIRQLNWSIDSVLESIAGKWDCIQTYDAITSTWKSYNIYRPAPLNDLHEMNHLKAYWINITEPGVTLTVKGDKFGSPLSIPLYAGWNFVGYPSLNNETVGNALWGTGADKVMACDTSEPYNIIEVGPTYVMKPGEGYWLHVPADTLWIVDW